MANIYKIDNPFALTQASIIRRRESSSEDLAVALRNLGTEVAKHITEKFYIYEDTVTTPDPLARSVTLPFVRVPLSVVITTKEDLQYFAHGLKRVLNNCESGWMDFEGRRGLEALDSPVRTMQFPDLSGQAVDSLIIGKATLATGCTAVSLTRTAFGRYMPERLIIASVFYSIRGLEMLGREFLNAHIFVVGEPDSVTDDGLLDPGIGILPQRLEVLG